MIAVVQRVSAAAVRVEDPNYVAKIEHGLVVLIAVEHADDSTQVEWMARKLAALRIFEDEEGRMNKSVVAVAGSILLISQFTLAGNCLHGHRPSFTDAAKPEVAAPLISALAERLCETGVPIQTGVFGAQMSVSLTNEGPVTLIVRHPTP